MASKICKTQLSNLGVYPEEAAFQKILEDTLEQERPGYIEKRGSQWMNNYDGKIKQLVSYRFIITIML